MYEGKGIAVEMVYSTSRTLLLRLAKHQVKIRFVFVGMWNTVFGYLAFYLLDTLFTHVFQKRYFAYMSALILAQVLAVVNAYFIHKRITFKSKIKDNGLVREFLRFSLTYAFTFCINLMLLPFFVEILHIIPKISGIILIAITMIISYIGHSKFSFGQKETY